MKEPTPTKKELITRFNSLEEQVTRLKNRLNGQVFKKTKHGYRLDQLSEGARELSGRIEKIESSIRRLSAQDAALAREQEILRSKRGGKKQLKAELKRLGSDIEGLYHQQQQLQQSLHQNAQVSDQIADLRDDLRREGDELKTQVRGLEESNSRDSISQSEQLSRIQALEGELAELIREQQRLSKAEQSRQASIEQALDDSLLPLQSTLQRLEGQSVEDSSQLEAFRQQLSELHDTIDAANETSRRLEQKQGPQQELRSRIENLEAKTESAPFQQVPADRLDQAILPLRAELERIETKSAGDSSRLDDIGQQLTALHGQVVDTQALLGNLEQHQDLGDRLTLLEQNQADLDSIDQRLRQLTQDQIPGYDERVTGVESEITRLSEAAEFLQESYRGLGSMELGLTSRLDGLQRQLDQHGQEPGELDQRLQQLSDLINGNQQRLLTQIDGLKSGIDTQRIGAEQQKRELGELARQLSQLEATEQQTAEQRPELTSALDRIEQAADADRERITLLESDLAATRDRSDIHGGELAAKVEAAASAQSQLEAEITQEKDNRIALIETIDQQNSRIETLSRQLDTQRQHDSECAETLQNLSALADDQDGQQQALNQKIENQQALLHELKSWSDDQGQLQQQMTTAVEASRASLDELKTLGLQSSEKIAGLDQGQQSLQKVQAEAAPLLEEHSGSLHLLHERLDKVDDNQGEQQTRIERNRSTVRTQGVALGALLLLGLLGGVALYFSNTAELAKSEQRMAQQLVTPDPRYITTERLSASLHSLQSAQSENRRRIDFLQTAQPPGNLSERQSELEQRLARQEVKLNLVTAGAGAVSGVEPGLSADFQQIQRSIEQLESRFDNLATAAPGDSGQRFSKFEQQLAELSEAVNTRLSRIEGEQRALRSKTGGMQASHTEDDRLTARVSELENSGRAARQVQQQLRNQIDRLNLSLVELEQRLDQPVADSAARWRMAGDSGRYTIQLAGARSLDSLKRFSARKLPKGGHAFYRTNYDGREWHILLYGIFSGVSQAKAALNKLPAGLLRYKPWIREVPADYTYISE